MRLAVLAHDSFDARRAKTANSLIKYAREGWSGDEVVAVVDREKAGTDAGDAVGEHGRGIPVVASTHEALALRPPPDALAIGIAPSGGALPADWRGDVEAALDAGLRVISGLHTPLAPLFPGYAKQIRDVRYEHPAKRITSGEGLRVDSLVVLAVGTDCNSGKMTVSIELAREARRRGLKAAFVATGQTGIMVGCDAGAPIDALVSDFVAGAVEECVLQAARSQPDIIFVEGQGSLTHPAYSGVTASLLHGAFPDVLVLCDEPRRPWLAMGKAPLKFRKNTAAVERQLNELHLAPTTGALVGAVSLLTPGLAPQEYLAERDAMERALGVPADDAFRGGTSRILDGVLAEAKRRGLWDERGLRRGIKPKRFPDGVV